MSQYNTEELKEIVDKAIDFMAYAVMDMQFNQELYFQKIMDYVNGTNPLTIADDFEKGLTPIILQTFAKDSLEIKFEKDEEEHEQH